MTTISTVECISTSNNIVFNVTVNFELDVTTFNLVGTGQAYIRLEIKRGVTVLSTYRCIYITSTTTQDGPYSFSYAETDNTPGTYTAVLSLVATSSQTPGDLIEVTCNFTDTRLVGELKKL